MKMHGENKRGEVIMAFPAKQYMRDESKERQQEKEQPRQPYIKICIKEFRIQTVAGKANRGFAGPEKYEKDHADKNVHPQRRYIPDPSPGQVLLSQKPGLQNQRPDTPHDLGVKGEVITEKVQQKLLKVNNLLLMLLTTLWAEIIGAF